MTATAAVSAASAALTESAAIGGSLNSLSLSPDKTRCAIAGREVLKIARIKERKLEVVKSLRNKAMNMNHSGFDVAWHPAEDCRHLIATAATNGALVIWDLNLLSNQLGSGVKKPKGQGLGVERAYTQIKRRINKLCWHPTNSEWLLIGGQDGAAKLVDIRADFGPGNPVSTFSSTRQPVKDVKFSPHYPNYFATALQEGIVQLWDVRKQNGQIFQTQAHPRLANGLDWHPTNADVLATCGDNGIQVWDLRTWRNSQSVNPTHSMHSSCSVAAVRWRTQHPDEVASCASNLDVKLYVWNVRRPYVPVAWVAGHSDVIADFAWLDEGTLLSCSKDCTLRVNLMENAARPYQSLRTVALAFDRADRLASVREWIDRYNPIPPLRSPGAPQPEGESVSVAPKSPSPSQSSWPVNFGDGAEIPAVQQQQSALGAAAAGAAVTFTAPLPRRTVLTSTTSRRPRALTIFSLSPLGFPDDQGVFAQMASKSKLGPVHFEKAPLTTWELCEHNAQVAEDLGRTQYAQLWRLARAVLDPASFAETEDGTLSSPTITSTDAPVGRATASGAGPSTFDLSDIAGRASPSLVEEADMQIGASSVLAPHEDDMPDFIKAETVTPFTCVVVAGAAANPDSPQKVCGFDNSAILDDHIEASRSSIQDWALPMKLLQHALAKTLLQYADMGETQICALMALVLGTHLDIDTGLLSRWIYSYLDQLQRLQMYVEANEVIKSCSAGITAPFLMYGESLSTLNNKATSVSVGCPHCQHRVTDGVAWRCRCGRTTSRCSVCNLPVKGLWAWCQGCGHGGHLQHLQKWFNNHQQCPAACSHTCVLFGPTCPSLYKSPRPTPPPVP